MNVLKKYENEIKTAIYGVNILIGAYIILFFLTVFFAYFTHESIFNVTQDSMSDNPVAALIAVTIPMFLALIIFPLAVEYKIKNKRLTPLGFRRFKELKKHSIFFIVSSFIVIIYSFISSGGGGEIWFLLFHYIVVGFGEEILFRGVLQRRLQVLIKPIIAIFIAALVFSFGFHTTGDLSVNLALRLPAGIILGIIYYKSGDLYSVSMLHIAYNFSIINI